MTRSDIILAIAKAEIAEPYNQEMIALIHKLHRKTENVYKIVFELEKDLHFKELGEYIRKALES
jgi:hypothetical protein